MVVADAYEVSIYIRVTDEAALLAAAKARATADKVDPDDVETVHDALRMLLDPGESPPGTEILDSTVE
jgi:hypothetical protein